MITNELIKRVSTPPPNVKVDVLDSEVVVITFSNNRIKLVLQCLVYTALVKVLSYCMDYLESLGMHEALFLLFVPFLFGGIFGILFSIYHMIVRTKIQCSLQNCTIQYGFLEFTKVETFYWDNVKHIELFENLPENKGKPTKKRSNKYSDYEDSIIIKTDSMIKISGILDKDQETYCLTVLKAFHREALEKRKEL